MIEDSKQDPREWESGRLRDRRNLSVESGRLATLSPDWMRQAQLLEPKPKVALSIRLDEDVIEWFKQRGRGYQTRINAVLRAYIDVQR